MVLHNGNNELFDGKAIGEGNDRGDLVKDITFLMVRLEVTGQVMVRMMTKAMYLVMTRMVV